mmetsp:Transcript_12736/g.21477  ORF Transcript_12736/g.21477 Transcript_12736/m.21477 type:complete len:88 (+) Transcript_12736:666-929(+)
MNQDVPVKKIKRQGPQNVHEAVNVCKDTPSRQESHSLVSQTCHTDFETNRSISFLKMDKIDESAWENFENQQSDMNTNTSAMFINNQ